MSRHPLFNRWRKRASAAAKITAIYVVIGVTWIAVSDWVVGFALGAAIMVEVLSTVKGLLYVAATGLLLYTLIRRTTEALQRSERALQESEARNRAFLNAIPDMMFRVRGDGTLLDFQPAKTLQPLLPSGEFLGKNIAQLLPKEATDRLRVALAQALATGGAQFCEYRLAVGDSVRDYEARIVASGEDDLLALVRDISEHKRADEALHESEERYRLLVELSPDAIAVHDQGKVIFVNPAGLRILGASSPEQVIGKPAMGFVHPDCRQAVAGRFRVLDRGQTAPMAEEKFLRLDGSAIDVEVTAIPIAFESKPAVQVVFRDITMRVKADEEKANMQAQLLQAQKMEAIGTLAGGVAHDFNNLLTAIQGHADLAMMEIADTESLYRDLRQIHAAAVRAAGLTRQLLLFSRQQPMEFVSVNLNQTVDNLLKMLRRIIGEDIAVETDFDPDLWPVRADVGRIEQAIMNLAVNARDAMPSGGRLTIATENAVIGQDQIRLSPEARPGRFACLSVADTGIGMDQEVMQHLFEPFFTTKGEGQGTGLGLSVVYGVIVQHEGWISVHSEVGYGSTFRVYLPASPVALQEQAPPRASAGELRGQGERILVVEDEPGVRTLASRVLAQYGYAVIEAASAAEALEAFEREAGELDLVFSDTILPDMGGLELVDRLRSRKPELPVVLSSGYTDQRSRWSDIHERGYFFIQKPYAPPDLLRMIGEALQ